MSNESQLILVVDDSLEDYTALERAVREVGMQQRLFHCEDGEDALDYLYHRAEFSDSSKYPRPSLVLLDLNMPGVDGKEVLDVVKNDPEVRGIPVIVYSSSSNQREIETCYSLGANSYMQKPLGLECCMEVMRNLNNYWFSTSILPEGK